VFGVLELQLSGKHTGQVKNYLAGTGTGKYSAADIGTFPWIYQYDFSGRIYAEEMTAFPHLMQWVERIKAVIEIL